VKHRPDLDAACKLEPLIWYRHLTYIEESKDVVDEQPEGLKQMNYSWPPPITIPYHPCSVFLTFSDTTVLSNLAPFCNQPMCNRDIEILGSTISQEMERSEKSTSLCDDT